MMERLRSGFVRTAPMSDASKALDEVLDELANKYQGPDYVAAKEGAERMYERWEAHE